MRDSYRVAAVTIENIYGVIQVKKHLPLFLGLKDILFYYSSYIKNNGEYIYLYTEFIF